MEAGREKIPEEFWQLGNVPFRYFSWNLDSVTFNSIFEGLNSLI
jgi:hypothetical protein